MLHIVIILALDSKSRCLLINIILFILVGLFLVYAVLLTELAFLCVLLLHITDYGIILNVRYLSAPSVVVVWIFMTRSG